MGENSAIEWTHHTFNPWRGCTKISEGCANCYAERESKRNPGVLGIWGDTGTRVVASESMWNQPLKWDKVAARARQRHRVFCASFADVFEDRPELIHPRTLLFRLIEDTPNLDWLLLTKRPQNIMGMLETSLIVLQGGDPLDTNFFANHGEEYPRSSASSMLNEWIAGEPPPNVWVGTSIENQAAADERIPELLKIPAAVRFLSCEPLLGPISLSPYVNAGGGVTVSHGIDCDWVIAGGESGPHARPCHPDWIRSLRDQCKSAGVPFFFKQWGEWAPWTADDRHGVTGTPDRAINWHWDDDASFSLKIGKKAAGRQLDGREWSEFPEVTT